MCARRPRTQTSGVNGRSNAASAAGSDSRGTTVKCLELIRACRLAAEDPIILVGDVDVHLVNTLLASGYHDLTVLNPSAEALEALRAALGRIEREVVLFEADVLEFKPHRRYALWHDLGSFHRLMHPEDRQRYVEIVQQALQPEGHLVVCASGPEGPAEYGGRPVARYSASRLASELGRQFELAEHALAVHPSDDGGNHQLLHCRFRRHAPHWPR